MQFTHLHISDDDDEESHSSHEQKQLASVSVDGERVRENHTAAEQLPAA